MYILFSINKLCISNILEHFIFFHIKNSLLEKKIEFSLYFHEFPQSKLIKFFYSVQISLAAVKYAIICPYLLPIA